MSLKQTLQLSILMLFCHLLQAKPPDFPAPKNASVSIVGKDMTVGGKKMHIRQFYTRDRMEKVKQFYRRKWAQSEAEGLPPFTETEVNPPWHIISRLEDGYLLTVQVQRADDGGSWGYLASSELAQGGEQPDANAVPQMPGSEVLHDVKTNDVGQSADTMLLYNKHSLSSNTNYYKSYYMQRGWRTDLDQAIPKGKMHVLAFTNGKEKINIVLTGDNNHTRIVVNKVVHSIL